jgi:hypothetical protein
MDQGQKTTDTGQREGRLDGVILASNVNEIRHRRLLDTLTDLSDPEIKRLTTAIKENQICFGTS